MLIDLTSEVIEILPHVAPTTLILRGLHTQSWHADLYDTGDEENLAEWSLIPVEAWQHLPKDALKEEEAKFVEWKIRRFGYYRLETTRLASGPPPNTMFRPPPNTMFRVCELEFLENTGIVKLVSELQREYKEEWLHLTIHALDFNPFSAEPAPISRQPVPGPRLSAWERLL